MNTFMINSGYDGCNYVRLYLPAVHNGFLLDKRNDTRMSPEEVREKLAQADVVVFHRAEQPEYITLAKMLKRDGKKIVMDNDDTFKIGDYHPLADLTPDGMEASVKKRQHNIEEFLKIADMATTSTEFLAEEYRQYIDNVVVLPNCVDEFDWEEPLRNEGDKVRIGIVGSAAIAYDYGHIKHVIQELSDRDDVELIMFGLGDKIHRKNNPKVTKVFQSEYDYWDSLDIEQFPWVKNSEYPTKLNEAKLDIMLIPRRDNYFNRCKSNVKFLEASMCEIPVIAQSFDDAPYEEITSDMGVLIKDDKQWIAEINRLVKDKDLRQSMGKKAKEYVLNNYNIEDHAPKWEVAYKKLCEK
jgi:O-antigen biosynthesis protein